MFDISRDMEVSQAMYCPYSTSTHVGTQLLSSASLSASQNSEASHV
jgi:hypothetical protein